MNTRVVFDTNVLVSAIGWGGTPGGAVKNPIKLARQKMLGNTRQTTHPRHNPFISS